MVVKPVRVGAIKLTVLAAKVIDRQVVIDFDTVVVPRGNADCLAAGAGGCAKHDHGDGAGRQAQ